MRHRGFPSADGAGGTTTQRTVRPALNASATTCATGSRWWSCPCG